MQLQGELPETSTYSARSWQWDPRGLLRIELTPRRKAPVEVALYEVEALGNLPGLMGQRFVLRKPLEPEAEPYEIVVGGLARCSCQAGQFRAKVGIDCCRHLAAMTAAYEAGAFGGVPGQRESTVSIPAPLGGTP